METSLKTAQKIWVAQNLGAAAPLAPPPHPPGPYAYEFFNTIQDQFHSLPFRQVVASMY